MLKPSGNPNGIYPTWCSFLCHFADVGLCSMFASNSAWIFGSGLRGWWFLCVCVCFKPPEICRPDVFFLRSEERCAPLRGQLSMNNGSGSTMMLEIRCQLVYSMPGVRFGRNTGPGVPPDFHPIRWVFATICFLRKVRGIPLISSPRCRRFS